MTQDGWIIRTMGCVAGVVGRLLRFIDGMIFLLASPLLIFVVFPVLWFLSYIFNPRHDD
jgi:hypothetical protein